jgi:hypothetical protein
LTFSGREVLLAPAQASADGGAFVFESSYPIPGFNNAGGYIQVYRYDVPARSLACVSCPPTGVSPTGSVGAAMGIPHIQADRLMSDNGSRIFFDTPDALVGSDVNGKRDVYEWENGNVFLISSGTNTEDSTYIDGSVSGSDIFFVTAQGLVSGDRDGGLDLYDARIPHAGDDPPPTAVPCEGEVCQGPPSVPELLGAPASAAFNGLGNVSSAPDAKGHVKSKPKKRAKSPATHRKKRHGKVKRKGRATEKVGTQRRRGAK